MPALGDIGLNSFLLFLGHRSTRSGNNQDIGILWHGRFLKQGEGADVVALLFQDFFGQRQATAVFIVQAALTMTFQKHQPLFGVFGHSNQGTGNFDFGWRCDANRLGTAFENGDIGLGDAIILCHLRLPVGIDKLDG